MTRIEAQGNARAAGVALLGVLCLAFAACLYGSIVYLEDGASGCLSLAAGAGADPPALAELCTPHRAARADTVRNLVVAAGVLLVVAGATARRRWLPVADPLPASWALPGWAVASTTLVGVLLLAAHRDAYVLSLGPASIAAGVLAAWAGATTWRDALTGSHLLAAAAVTVPVGCTGMAVIEALRSTTSSVPWRDQDARLTVDGGAGAFALFLAVTAVLIAAAVALTKLERRAPNVWVSAALFTVSTTVVVPVFVPDLVPAWREPGTAPGPDVWLPLLLAPAGLAVVVWAVCAARRVRGREPAFG